jgi:hypothetical protein
MQKQMPSARALIAPAAPRRPLRSLVVGAAVAGAALASALVPAATASADVLDGATVVGELVQAWPDEQHTDASHEARGPLTWVETAEGAAVRVPSDEVAGIPAGSTVEVTVGAQVDDEASAEDGYDPARTVMAADVLATPTASSTLSDPAGLTNRVTVVLVTPQDVARDDVTEQQLVTAVDGPVADFWSEQTGGAVQIGVTASHGWISTTAGCSDPTALWNEAAVAVGFEPGPGRHLMLYVSSAATTCSYALAEVGSGASTGGRLYVRDTGASLIAHELGHNFGLGHSSARQCDGAVETSSCRTAAYRDLYDVMGASWAQLGSLNAAQAARLGVLPAAQQQALTVREPAATVTLAPLSGSTGTRALRLTDADGVDYWLEYRTATGRDAWLDGPENDYRLETGVLLRRAEGLPDTSVLLDGTPAAAGGWDADLQAALPLEASVPVSGGDFSVVVRGMSAAGAVLEVVPSAARTASSPAPTADPVAPPRVMSGSVGAVATGAGVVTVVPRREAEIEGARVLAGAPALEAVADTSSDDRWRLPVLAAAAGLLGLGCIVVCIGARRRAVVVHHPR